MLVNYKKVQSMYTESILAERNNSTSARSNIDASSSAACEVTI